MSHRAPSGADGLSRRAFLASAGALATATLTKSSPAAVRSTRMRWPWPVQLPKPHVLDDLVAALLGSALFPTLYVRAIDGVVEPRLAMGFPHETKTGVRVDLAGSLRPSDVVASIASARSGGAKLLMRDVPVPRVEGARSVFFPGIGDVDGLMRRLCSPLTGIARVELRGLSSTGSYDVALDARDRGHRLRLTRRPLAPATAGFDTRGGFSRIMRFELEGYVDLAVSLREFERGDSEIAWLGDGLFAERPGSRAIDLGPLAHVVVVAGEDGGPLAAPGAVQRALDALPPERLDHLGLFRRETPPTDKVPTPARLAERAPIHVRASMPVLVAAAEILARELGGEVRPLDDAELADVMRSRKGALTLRLARPVEEGSDGLALTLATAIDAPAPPVGTTARTIAAATNAAIGWELPLVGAEAPNVWIPRATSGGFDLDAGGEL